MTRSEALAGMALGPLAALSACGPNLRAIAATNGSPRFPTTFGCQIYPVDDVRRTIPLLAALGAKIVRVNAVVDAFSYFDAVFAAAADHAMRVLLISPYAAQPVDVNAYAQTAVQFHKRYAAFNPIWELWNEPNLAAYWGAPPDGAAYAKLAIATATTLRNAGATDVLSGGTSGVDINWLYELRMRGVLDVVTGCAVHSYKLPENALNEYLQAASLMPPGMQLYTTEACVVTSDGQSSFFSDMWYLHRDLGLPMMIWCEFRDGTAGPTPPYTDPMGLVASDYVPKTVYYRAEYLVNQT